MKALGVWITRLHAESLIQQLQTLGAHVLHAPTVELTPREVTPSELSYLQQRIDFIIFVSPMAVQYGLPLLAPHLLNQTTLVAVGEGTRSSLAAYGMLGVLAPDQGEGSTALLELPALQALTGKTVVVVAGEGGRTVLAETLSARGATVHTLLCYARQMPILDLSSVVTHQKAVSQHMIVATSATALDYLSALLPAAERQFWQRQALLVSSDRVAAIAQQLGFSGEIINASGASDAALMTALMAWYGHNNSTTSEYNV
jgi:uroporphyrinogen-III synthase